MKNDRQSRQRQSGVVLLSLMLLVLVAGSFVLLKALNVAALNALDDPDTVTRQALKQAKQALIGYAVNTPALTPAALGPGRLPCPDLTGDGAAAGTCSLGGANEMTGRFPYAEIRSNEIVDGAGAALWYSLDEAYRYHLAGTAINSDTANVLRLDAQTDIVAVIIAPGAATGDQDRSPGATIADFLEGENATLGDAQFATTDADITFNDTVIAVTRAEMMAAVEQRVLAEATNALNEYYRRYGGYPWASAFQNPATSRFAPGAGVRAGQLPLHVDNPGVDDDFTAPFTLSWNIPVDGALPAGAGTQDACVRSNQCNDDDIDIDHDFAGTTVTFATGVCTWTNAETFDCRGSGTVTTPVSGGTLERTYAVDLEIIGVDPVLVAPTPGTARLRNLAITNGQLPAGSSGTITVQDKLNGASRGPARTLTVSAGDTVANLSLSGVPFYLGDDRGEVAADNSPASLPHWFTDNDWHHFVYFAFAAGEALGGSGCTAGTDCLTVNWDRTGTLTDQVITKARGIALTAGADLDPATARPNAVFGDYFEGENADLDTVYARAAVTVNANDQLRILDPNE